MRLTAMQNQQESKQVLAHSDNSNLVEVRAEQFSGPLPHPGLLEHYNRIIPNAAERIFTEFEQQAKHRIEMEKAVVASAVWKEKWGLVFGFVFAMTVIILGVVTALMGAPLLGGSLSFAGLALIVTALVATRFNSNSKEN